MSAENVETVRRAVAALNAGDHDGALADFHPDVEWRDLMHAPDIPERVRGAAAVRAILEQWDAAGEYHASQDDPDSAVHRGIDAVRRQFATWHEAYPDLRVEPLETRAHGDKVFLWVRFAAHGAGSGIPIEMELAQVLTMREG